MKKEPEDPDMRPEYDFSHGVRGKYAPRFRETARDVTAAAGVLDRQAWLAHSLLAFQQFESKLVAYRALVFGEEPESAGKTVSALLEAIDTQALEALWRDLREHASARASFYKELRELLADRNWLVHRSFHDMTVEPNASGSLRRFESIATQSARLSEQLSSYLLERCKAQGMDPSEVRRRAEEVVDQWAASKDAA